MVGGGSLGDGEGREMEGKSLWWAGESANRSGLYVASDSGEAARACHRYAGRDCRSVVVKKHGPVDFEFVEKGSMSVWGVDALEGPFQPVASRRVFNVLANSAERAVIRLLREFKEKGVLVAVHDFWQIGNYAYSHGESREGFEYEKSGDLPGGWEEWTAREKVEAKKESEEWWWYWEVRVSEIGCPFGVVARSAEEAMRLVAAEHRTRSVVAMDRLFFCHEVGATSGRRFPSPRLYEVDCENSRGTSRSMVRVVADSVIDASLAATERTMPVGAECSWSAKPREIRVVHFIEGGQ